MKVGDLESFLRKFRTFEGLQKRRISDTELRLAIGREFGISDYIQGNILKNLHFFGLIAPDEIPGVWKLNIEIEEDEKKREEEKMEEMLDAHSKPS